MSAAIARQAAGRCSAPALPGALPFIMTGIKLGIGLGLILIAIAKMLGAKSGLGYLIWNALQILDVNVSMSACS
jgi:ABC-type nitrate/sulfonate/bicarbonate transport system permease component